LCYLRGMGTVGLRELRQNASRILRRVEGGEEIVVAVAGRPSARLVPVEDRQWRAFSALQSLFNGAEDPNWEEDRDRIDQTPRDPWASE